MFIEQQVKKLFKSQSGFTLVELSIVLIIIGILMSSLGFGLRLWSVSQKHKMTKVNLENAEYAISQFRGPVGRYPCPADPALNPGDAGYGFEDCTLPVTNGIRIGMMPLKGYDDANATPTALPELIIDLKSLITDIKSEGNSIRDPWNINFIYAVTASQNIQSTFDTTGGAIKITDEWGNDTGGTNSDAHFVILSRGEDASCAGRGPAEAENCDNDNEFTIALQSRGNAAANYYDDYLTFRRSTSTGIWAPVTGTTDLYPMPAGKIHVGSVGIYEEIPAAALNLKMDVDGNIISEERLAAELLCDDSAMTSCFKPQTIFDLNCGSYGQYMKGVTINSSNNLVPICEEIEFIQQSENCASGKYLRGIYTNGENIICDSL